MAGVTLDLHYPAELDKLRSVWRRFAEHECGSYAPLYRAVCEVVADETSHGGAQALQLTAAGPSHARQPNLLLAAVHFLVIRHRRLVTVTPDRSVDRLAKIYETGGHIDPGAAFLDVVLAHRCEIAELLATRFTQTNECGRSAPLALALRAAATANRDDNDQPATLALIDAGCSAGLNLAVDRYRIDFGAAGAFGPTSGTVVESELIGPYANTVLPLPESLDVIGWRVGLERAPVELHDDAATDWLLACVWPDHRERLARAASALRSLAANPPRIVRGDMVDDLEALIDQAPSDHLVTVLTSWSAAYLRPADRGRLVHVLERASHQRPIVWLSMEAPGVVPGIEVPDFTVEAATSPSLVGSLRFDRGVVTATTLGWTHAHGVQFAPAGEIRA